jgi:gliding motility-associated-like protein
MKKFNQRLAFFFLFIAHFLYAQVPPNAVDDSISTERNTTLNVAAPGVLANDTDTDGDVLLVTSFSVNGTTFSPSQTANFAEGSITIGADGSYTFIPTSNYVGAVPTINYSISDGRFTSSAILTITVVLPPEPPVAIDDSNSTFRNTTLNVAAPGVLVNDTDANGDVLLVTEFQINGTTFLARQTANFAEGSITIADNGSYTFTPTSNYVGALPTINYSISDGRFTSSAILTITVVLPPEPPVASDDTNSTLRNTTLNVAAPGVLVNDTDANGDVLSVTEFQINGITFLAGQTANFAQGSLTVAANGSYTFIPASNFVGVVSTIIYTITDGTFTTQANLNLTVLLPPTPPIAVIDYDTVEINTTLNVAAPGVLANDTDVNGDVLTVTRFLVNGITYLAGQTAVLAQGNITIAANGSYTFIPTPNYTGDVPVITYTITDGTFTASTTLNFTVENIDNLLEISSFESCNQGYTSNGEYKVIYTLVLLNKSTARDYHPTSLIKNINITNNLQTTFGNTCVVEVTEVSVSNNIFTKDFLNPPVGGYPKEFTNDAINDGFLNITSNSVFSNDAIDNLILYPRQNVTVSFCVTIKPFCDGRPNPTPSGAGINFNNILDVTSDRGNVSSNLLLTDFHTTEAIVTAGLYIPEFNDSLNPPGVINFDGTYDYANRVIITNQGTATAANINYNMGLGSFFDNGITFSEIRIQQVSGPNVTINSAYNGNTESLLLAPNNTLAAGEKIILELFYVIEPYKSNNYSFFYQIDRSQTQGILDGFNESTAVSKRRNSFVLWSDNLGNHIDRYYRTSSATESVSSTLQCNCETSSMRFLFTAASSTNKIISNVNSIPNGILEHEQVTFQITIKNTSESIQIRNLQIQDNLLNICGGKILSVSAPVIQNSSANTNPIINSAFNGVTDINFFDGTSGLLKVDEIITIQYTVLFEETCNGLNRATFFAKDPLNNTIVSNSSVDVNSFTDTDNDNIPNTDDLDDDNDTIPDIVEYNGLNPLDDHDSDTIPNYRDTDFGVDANGDGIVDVFDFDNDGIPNHFDLDSDNDGILDIVEAGNGSLDTSRNGRTNNPVGLNGLDNTLENNDLNNAVITFTIPNTDTIGNPNFLDIDADDDGIVDNIEAQLTANYISLNGIVSEDGIDTAYPNGLTPIDTDSDGVFDYIDTNSDNDIRNDIVEGWDTNADGIPEITPSNLDADNDGLDDAFDTNDNLVNPSNGQNPMSFPNVDNADTPERDWRELIAIVVIVDNISVTEGNDLVFTFSLVTKNDETISVESTTPIVINLSTLNGTTTTNIYDVATSPFDFSGISNRIFTINPFTTAAQFTVTSLEDIIFEQTEFFTLQGTITSNNTLNNSVIGIGTILDNDVAPSITMNNTRENEGVSLLHTITISHPCSTPIIIDVKTSDNLAISPNDYTPFSEILTINGTTNPNNANLQISFSFISNTDNLNELEEENVNVTGIVTSNNVGNQDLNKTAIIVDIDPNPLIFINNVVVEEGEILQFTISLLNTNLQPMQNYLDINLLLETIDNTTFANEDYEFVNVLRTIPALTSSINQTVISINDKLNEDTETFILQATTNLSNVSNTFPPSGIGTIKDNDYPNLFSPNGDGKSDVFKISGIVEDYPNFTLIIYNRQGNEVYKYSNNGNSNPVWWDGTYNGNPAATGVYYYTLEYNDGITKPKTNFIQLIR